MRHLTVCILVAISLGCSDPSPQTNPPASAPHTTPNRSLYSAVTEAKPPADATGAKTPSDRITEIIAATWSYHATHGFWPETREALERHCVALGQTPRLLSTSDSITFRTTDDGRLKVDMQKSVTTIHLTIPLPDDADEIPVDVRMDGVRPDEPKERPSPRFPIGDLL